MPNIMLQLDGPTSVRVHEEDNPCQYPEELQYLVMDILMIVTVISIIIDSVRIEDIQEEEGITKKEVEGHLMEKITRVKVIQEEEDPLLMEDHLMMEDPLTMEDPDDGGPPDDGGTP